MKAKYRNYRKKDPFRERELETYPDPIPSREYILECLEKEGEPLTLEQVITLFGLNHEDAQEAMRRRLIAMERDGQVMRNRKGKYALVNKLELVRGRVVGHRDGFGFLIPDCGGDDLYLKPFQMRSLFPGDRVLARAIEHSAGRKEGIVVEILERKTEHLTGRYFEERNIAFVQPDHKEITQDILIPPGEAGGAKTGQYVTVEIMNQPSARRQASGRVIEIIGEHLDPGMEIEVAIRSHEIPHKWSNEVKRELSDFDKEVLEEHKKGRLDLRNLPLVTIDGEDAKDFDDAVFCEIKADGTARLVVAIADVSFYVKPNSALDIEASNRGNSTYFPGRVVPMLPEILSNELCSLKPQVDRLCMACDMEISNEGELLSFKFYEALMRSRARLTYTEVARMLEGGKVTQPALLPHLEDLYTLYKRLIKQRANRGALDFSTVETRIIFAKNRKIKEIIPVVRTDAHRLIEECMLVANVAAARFLEKNEIPTLYRVHAGPNPDKIEALQDFLKSMGLRLTGGNKPTPMDYYRLLQRISGRVDEHLIQTVLLRSLMQAEYSPNNIGHFGLAYESYAHFTSPIRRYPDLLVHRTIRHQLKKGKKSLMYDNSAMAHFGEHSSMTERRSDEATRDAVNWLKCYYMQNKIGQTFNGIITGVTGFGVFVELHGIYVEGLVHITGLKNDYYHFEAGKHRLVGKHSGTIYRLGDTIRVLVARVDLDERKIDFELA